ncbi:MAG: PLP-dependent transferase [Crenarchaeota archaeon]|nr:PLP-dependent transferase [Thermoproteota archaeon]
MRFATRLIHGGRRHTFHELGTVVEPIFTSAVYVYHHEVSRETPHVLPYKYSREDNPTVAHLEEKIRSLDSAEACIAFSSGIASIRCVIDSLVEKLGRLLLIAPLDLYGSTLVLFRKYAHRGLIELETVPPGTESILEKLKSIDKGSVVIFLEEISNPVLRVYDIEEISKNLKDHKYENSLLIVDNTIPTQVGIRPIEHGADIVVYSASKYLSGHNDAIGGIVALSGSVKELEETIWHSRRLHGCIMTPFTAYLLDRGLKTLHLRMMKHEENARAVAEFLLDHSKVNEVIYPGLSSHPDFKTSIKMLGNTSGIVSFRLKNDPDLSKMFKKLRIIIPGVSFGGPETIITHPLSTTHRYLEENERKIVGIDQRLFRLSVGLEDVEDIIEDLDSMLREVY